MDALFFWIFAGVAIVASVLVVGQRNPMYSVLLLILSFGALSGLYVLLNAPFMAVVQIIIYAGAIMVLFLFVVMLLNVRHEDEGQEGNDPRGRLGMGPGPRRFGAVLAVLLAVQLIWALRRIADAPFAPAGEGAAQTSSVNAIGLRLFREYAFAFEATSVLILVAMVGAVILARKDPHHPTLRKDQ
jgi:NADH-quinone oxidoreductase subunit J